MRQHYNPLEKQAKRLIPLAIAAIGGGVSPLWAQTADMLDTVVVTASRAQERVREVSSNVTVIDTEDIQASTASTVADLMVEHGFQVITLGDTSGVQIRGYGSMSMPTEHTNTVLMLLDGRRIGNANPMLSGLANVERIEIIRGPSAVQYGSSALGGVINIITQKCTEKPFASLELGLGGDKLKKEKIALGGAAGGFDFALGATNYSHNDVTIRDGDRFYNTKIDRNSAMNFDLGYTFNKNHRIGINYNYADIKSELPGGGIRGACYGGYCYAPPATRPLGPWDYSKYTKRNTNTALTYTGSTNDKVFDWSATYSSGRNDQKGISGGGGSPWGSKVDTDFFNAQAGWHGSMFSLSGGVDQYKYEIRSNISSPAKSTMEDTGVYLTGKLRLFDDERLIFSAGLRHDDYTNKGNRASNLDKRSDDHTSGSIGVAYLPIDWLKLRANYAEGFKMPSPDQAGTRGSRYIPNPSLKPEKSKTWELGSDISWRYFNASLTYFHSNYEDKIIGIATSDTSCADFSSNPPCHQFQNLKGATLAGWEGSVNVDIGKAFGQNYSLKPYLSFTYLGTRENRDQAPERSVIYNGRRIKTLPNTPEWMTSYGVDYAHPGYKIKSRIAANYYGGDTYTTDYSQASTPYIRRPTGTVVNWSLDKELVQFSDRFGKLTLRTEIINLFDGKNEMLWDYPGPGRSFYVGLRYDY